MKGWNTLGNGGSYLDTFTLRLTPRSSPDPYSDLGVRFGTPVLVTGPGTLVGSDFASPTRPRE